MDLPNPPAPEYDFTSDWFSSQIPNWKEWLWELRDSPIAALEIGSWEGRSSVWLLDNILVHEDASLTCIDLFSVPDAESRFDSNIEATGRGASVVKLKGQSWEHLRTLTPDSYHLIYIDGSHHGRDVLEDAILAYRLTTVEGLIIFDDYLWDANPNHSVYPVDAIDAFLSLYNEFVEVIHKEWQVCVKKVA
jgi:predicted O-methyltransferase YrrM